MQHFMRYALLSADQIRAHSERTAVWLDDSKTTDKIEKATKAGFVTAAFRVRKFASSIDQTRTVGIIYLYGVHLKGQLHF